MPIEVLTGLPRNGKTLRMMHLLTEAAKKAQRPLYASGIDGLTPGLAGDLPNPLDWNAIDPNVEGDCTCGHHWKKNEDGTLAADADGKPIKVLGRPPHAHVIPDGSLIFVDEAWKWFGHLHNATGQKTPQAVLDFAEHGHRGLDFVFTTQGPGQLYPFLRTLIGEHTHVVRAMGMQAANLYTWAELNDDVKSRSMRDLAIKTLWIYPRDLYDKYKSASVHTVKRKIPWKIALIPLSVIGALLAAYVAYANLKPSARGKHGQTAVAEASGLPGANATQDGTAPPVEDTHSPEAIKRYALQFVPRIPEIPASAPAYDGREVVADPKLFCVISGPGETATGYEGTDRCSCRTEQFTVHKLEDTACRMLAREGAPYDPYKQPEGNNGFGDTPQRDFQPTGRSAAAPLTGVIQGEQVSGYGDLGIGAQSAPAPR